MSETDTAQQPRWTFLFWVNVYCGGLLLLFVGLIGRLYYLQVDRHQTYAETQSGQTESVKKMKAPRGNIFDDQGRMLVTSQLRMSVYADPGMVDKPERTARKLASILDVSRETLESKLRRPKDRFIWVKRRITPSVAERLRQEDLHGVRFRREYDRLYPHGTVASQVLGIVGADQRGLSGLEAKYDDELTGNPARVKYKRDGTRKLLFQSSLRRQSLPEPGTDLHLTLDLSLQEIVEEELDRLNSTYEPNWSSVVVMDPSNGAVRAMANRPTFDPSDYADSSEGERRNRAVTDPVEPGSSLKPFIMAAALEEGILTPQSKIFCEEGSWQYRGRVLHDYKSFGMLTASEVIVHSSNIGMAKIGIELGGQLRPWVRRFAFGSRTGIGFPGEDPGRVQSRANWNEIYTQTSVPMGHEILTTPLQMTRAFCALANGGYLVRPRIVKGAGTRQNALKKGMQKRVLKRKTVTKLKRMLRKVVTDGTGETVQTDLIRIAGKTGTSRKYKDRSKYLSVFIGFAPVDQPELVVAGFVDEPDGAYSGGKVVGPMVRRIFERATRFKHMNINSSGVVKGDE